ncbi:MULTISPECIES: DoxX family protein [unclassified Sphingopyxis]|jgi:putative oxidoreductase|uniref:DoxX family protein n=1 Tax=unclassified Sphingopyxis TaxID=2614943 RepID=UPI0006C1475A|nr:MULTISPECIES: DoxX family protein [unclassified Sphingopyxis]USI75473.1 DoxX family protein [Sphingopyxis sp. USTB-05]GAO78020.1 putative membrane protein [Sphingopyxis sp. C-1]
MSMLAVFIGRLFIALIFIVSGINKLIHVSDTSAMISAAGLPGGLAVPTGLFELVAGICIALGIAVRLWSTLLAGFVLATIIFFHREFTDPVQAMAAMKNLAIAGGLLCLFGYGHTRWSYDALRAKRRAEVAESAAQRHAAEAELRAARAEGRAEAVGAPVVVEKRPFWRR